MLDTEARSPVDTSSVVCCFVTWTARIQSLLLSVDEVVSVTRAALATDFVLVAELSAASVRWGQWASAVFVIPLPVLAEALRTGRHGSAMHRRTRGLL